MRRPQRGFILVLVLWVLLALTIAASALAAWISRTTQQAVVMADERRGQVDRFSTLETLNYLLASRPRRIGGVYMGAGVDEMVATWRADPFAFHQAETSSDDLALDGRAYRGPGGVKFILQDEAGLINPNIFQEDWMLDLLARSGEPVTRRRRLLERLADFTEYRPGQGLVGVRGQDYRAAGLPPPPNRFLLAPLELVRVLDWDQVVARNPQQWQHWLSVHGGGSLNMNTAPPALLEAVPEITRDTAMRIVQMRQTRPFVNVREARERTGRVFNEFAFRTLPGEAVRVTIANSDRTRPWRYHWRATPQHDGGAPWAIELAYPLAGQTPSNGVSVETERAAIHPHPLLAAPEDVDARRR